MKSKSVLDEPVNPMRNYKHLRTGNEYTTIGNVLMKTVRGWEEGVMYSNTSSSAIYVRTTEDFLKFFEEVKL
jgi:hypothetical protein